MAEHLRNKLSGRKVSINVIYTVTLLFFLVYFVLAYLKFRSHNTLADLPIYSQAMWNTLHGRIMYATTVYLPQGYNHLGDHLSLSLFLLLPIYTLYPSPVTLLVTQSFFLAVAAIPIYRLARERLGEKSAVFLATGYLLHPTVWYSNLNDFHLTSIAAALISFSFYYCYKRDYGKFLIFLILLLLTKEDLILLGAAFGVYIYFINRDRVLGSMVFLTSILWFIAAISVVMPHFREGVFEASEFYLRTRYGYLGSSFTEVLKTVLFHPLVVLSNVVTIPKMAYLGSLFLPVAFLPLLSPAVLLIVSPVFVENLLSSYLWQYLPTTQYSTVTIPILYAAVVFGAEKIRRRKEAIKAVLLLSLSTNLIYGPPPQGLVWSIGPEIQSSYAHLSFTTDERDRIADEILLSIPEEASLAASSNLIAHAPLREKMYQAMFINITFAEEEVDYVLLDTQSYFYKRFDREARLAEALSNSTRFTLVENRSGFLLFARK
jgi:uncharacterized membrane protein